MSRTRACFGLVCVVCVSWSAALGTPASDLRTATAAKGWHNAGFDLQGTGRFDGAPVPRPDLAPRTHTRRAAPACVGLVGAGPIAASSIISGIARRYSVDNAIASGVVMTSDGSKVRAVAARELATAVRSSSVYHKYILYLYLYLYLCVRPCACVRVRASARPLTHTPHHTTPHPARQLFFSSSNTLYCVSPSNAVGSVANSIFSHAGGFELVWFAPLFLQGSGSTPALSDDEATVFVG